MSATPRQLIGPKPTTAAHRLVQACYEHGPLTVAEGVAIHGKFYRFMSHHMRMIDKAESFGWIVWSGVKYDLTKALRETMDRKKAESDPAPPKPVLVASPYRPAFKPLSMQHMPTTAPRRPDALPAREISFKSCTSAVPVSYDY